MKGIIKEEEEGDEAVKAKNSVKTACMRERMGAKDKRLLPVVDDGSEEGSTWVLKVWVKALTLKCVAFGLRCERYCAVTCHSTLFLVTLHPDPNIAFFFFLHHPSAALLETAGGLQETASANCIIGVRLDESACLKM
eukprot:3627175-Rhodomonas_salina.2